jgi:hypothetical protein
MGKRVAGVFGTGILLGAFLLCPEPFAAKALDWPSPGGNMARNFGFNLDGRPAVGVSFETEEPVRAAEAGELFFSRSSDDTASRMPSPMGSWLALDHGDGLISIYSRFDEIAGGRDAVSMGSPPAQVDRNAIIARAGSGGWSAFKGFFFAIFDRRERRWVNPAMIIAPLPDTRPPQIISVTLIAEDGRATGLLRLPRTGAQAAAAPGRINQGRSHIAVEAADTRLEAGEKELAPHRILCLVNGVETGALNFETYSARDGVLMVDRNGLTPVEEVYAPYPAFDIGSVWLTRGQATLEVIVQDISGNERSAAVRFTVE